MTNRYTWKDDPNGIMVSTNDRIIQLSMSQESFFNKLSTVYLTTIEARSLASALMIAAEAIDEEKEKGNG